MTRNTQQSNAASPVVKPDDATIGDLCRHVKRISPDTYDSLPDAAAIRDGVLDVHLAEIAHDSATEQALQIAEDTGWMLPGSVLEDLNKAIRNETTFDRGDVEDYFLLAE